MEIDGGCHCGAIRYRAKVDPERVSICHCTDCQQLTGTAFRLTVPASSEDLEFTQGEPKIYRKTTADSGNVRLQAFCGTCGSPLYATSAGEDPKVYGLRVGTVRQRNALPPKRAIWCQSALEWLPEIANVPGAQKEWKAEP